MKKPAAMQGMVVLSDGTKRVYAVKRREGVEGAERRLVPTTRSEEEPDDVEQRSAEGSAVPPGEAKGSANHLKIMADQWLRDSEEAERNACRTVWPWRRSRLFMKAAILRDHGRRLRWLLGLKPDSDAR